MEWFIENKSMDKHSVAATKTYGTSRMDAYSIFEDTLNLKTVTVRDRIDDGDGRYHYEVNKNETMLAREKQNVIREKFKEWLFSEPERRQKYVEYYNETFNNIRLREYDGSHLQFPGMNPAIELKPHQKNAVARILDKEKHMENAKTKEQTEPERAEAERVEAEIVYAPMVAEPQEYQYNADAFEARGVDEVKQEAAHKEVSKVRADKAR